MAAKNLTLKPINGPMHFFSYAGDSFSVVSVVKSRMVHIYI